ncbi:MAG: zeta toxin family protein [Patescibacteria group bacterium]
MGIEYFDPEKLREKYQENQRYFTYVPSKDLTDKYFNPEKLREKYRENQIDFTYALSKNLTKEYYLSKEDRKELHRIINNSGNSAIEKNIELSNFIKLAEEKTNKHLAPIGLNTQQNIDLINCYLEFNSKDVSFITKLSEKDLQNTPPIIHTIDQYNIINGSQSLSASDEEIRQKRLELHQDIIDNFRITNPKNISGNPELIIVGGCLGAGKSIFINRAIPTILTKHAYIDSNLIKPKLVGEDYSENNIKQVLSTHQESSWLARKILNESIASNINLIYETTLDDENKIRSIINTARARSYSVYLVYLHGGIESWRRNSLNRARTIKPAIFNNGFIGYLNLKKFAQEKLLPMRVIDNSTINTYSTTLIKIPDIRKKRSDYLCHIKEKIPEFEKYCKFAQELHPNQS